MKYGYLSKERINPCRNLREGQVVEIHGILHCDPHDMEEYNLYLCTTHILDGAAFAYLPLEEGETYHSYCNRDLNSYRIGNDVNVTGIIWVDAKDIEIDTSNSANKYALERLED